jgi:hypothetical protein
VQPSQYFTNFKSCRNFCHSLFSLKNDLLGVSSAAFRILDNIQNVTWIIHYIQDHQIRKQYKESNFHFNVANTSRKNIKKIIMRLYKPICFSHENGKDT